MHADRNSGHSPLILAGFARAGYRAGPHFAVTVEHQRRSNRCNRFNWQRLLQDHRIRPAATAPRLAPTLNQPAMNDNPKNASAWESVPVPQFSTVSKSRRFDVVIVGGGITGLTAAYLLKRAGKKVCVLEREQIGGVDTSHTTAHLTQVTDLRLPKLAKHFGNDAARLAWLGGAAAINTIEEIVAALGIGCQFTRVPGYLPRVARRNERRKRRSEARSRTRRASWALTRCFSTQFRWSPSPAFATRTRPSFIRCHIWPRSPRRLMARARRSLNTPTYPK